MPWFPIALSTAIFTAASDAFTKAYLRPLGTIKMAMARVIAPVFFLLPILLFLNWPYLPLGFWKCLTVLLPLETTALVLYMEAIRTSDLSVSIPFLAFTPAFIILTGWLILGEHLTFWGIIGIMFIVIGSYFLHLNSIAKGLFSPIKAIFKNRGSFLMLAVAFIYSITSVLGKLAIAYSNPIFFACFYFVIHGLFSMATIAVFFKVTPLDALREAPKGVILTGISQTLMVLTHMWAISLAPVAYMIAVKRLSVLFGVAIGCLIFKEKEMRPRFLGASFMVLGVFLIALS